MFEAEVVAQSSGYQVIKRNLIYEAIHPRAEYHGPRQPIVVGYYLRDENTGSEKQIDLHASEVPKTPRFNWVGPGVVEWERAWITGMRMSPIFGKTTVRGLKVCRFDFNQPSSSSIFFQPPEETSEDYYEYQFAMYSERYDFSRGTLHIWHST